MRAAVDVMGGDQAPAAILKGCWEAAPLLDGDDRRSISSATRRSSPTAWPPAASLPSRKRLYKIVPTTQVIEMDDSPVEAIRNKPEQLDQRDVQARREGRGRCGDLRRQHRRMRRRGAACACERCRA